MPATPTASTVPYRFAPSFEKEVLRHLIFCEKFWIAAGPHLDSAALSEGMPQLVGRAIMTLGAEFGHAPGSGTLVVERIARWREVGHVTFEQIFEAEDFVGALESLPMTDAESVLSQLIPTIKLRQQRENLKFMMDRVGARADDLDDVIERIQGTNTLGKFDVPTGISVTPEALALFAKKAELPKLPLGIGPLDAYLGGGQRSKTLSVFMGSTGDGKSMALCHVAGTCLLNHVHVFVATLELSEDEWFARLVANITGIPIESLNDGSLLEDAQARLSKIYRLAHVEIAAFTPMVTSVAELLAFVEERERKLGVKFRVLAVDYADLLGHGKSKDYEGARSVYAELRKGFALKRDGWVWTASASRRKQKPKDIQGIEDGADSQHKARLADLWIPISFDDQEATMQYSIAKNRYGRRGFAVTIPTELECARMVPEAYRTMLNASNKAVYSEGDTFGDQDLPF